MCFATEAMIKTSTRTRRSILLGKRCLCDQSVAQDGLGLAQLTIVLSTRCAHRGTNEVLESLVLILHCLYYSAKALITKTRGVQAIRVDAQALPAKAHGGRSQLAETRTVRTAQRAIIHVQTSRHTIGDHQFVHLYNSCVLQNVVVINSRV
jgi:hypothetical protein